ncbi:hypothetical protein D3C86_1872460 [compost metagenome]
MIGSPAVLRSKYANSSIDRSSAHCQSSSTSTAPRRSARADSIAVMVACSLSLSLVGESSSGAGAQPNSGNSCTSTGAWRSSSSNAWALKPGSSERKTPTKGPYGAVPCS